MANRGLGALILTSLLATFSSAQTITTQACSADGTTKIQDGAKAWIIGILSLNEQGTGGYGCGSPSGSMHSYEAMRFALELLNKKGERLGTTLLTDSYVPGIKLGMKVKNYCDNEKSAVAAISEYFPELMGDATTCTKRNDELTLGIIGGSVSDVAMALSEEGAPHNIPVISYEATAPQLTNMGKYPNFMRTISPDGPLMEVIAEIMKKLKWEFVTIVYDSGVYGRTGYANLHSILVANGICVTAGIMIEDHKVDTAEDTMNQVLNSGVNGAVFIGSRVYTKALVEAGNKGLVETGRIQWIVTDIGLDMTFPSGSTYQRGILAVTSASRFIVEFEDHWMRIDENKPGTVQKQENPWYRAYFEEKYDCSFTPASGIQDCATYYGSKNKSTIEDEKRRAFQQDQYAESAVMAVYTYATALRAAQIAKCLGVSGPCQALLDMTREDFNNNYLKKVDLTFKTTERIPTLGTYDVAPYYSPKRLYYKPNGDVADASYFIWNYNDIELARNAPKTFQFRRVGSFVNNRLEFQNWGFYSNDRQILLNGLPPASCPALGCKPCLGLPSDFKYYYEPGDLVVSGVFSLHKMGNTPISCGAMISPNQFQYLEAMIYAIKSINADSSVLPNIKLGGLAFDDCSSAVLSTGTMAQFQRGVTIIKAADGTELDPRLVEAWTAAQTSELTLPLAKAMNMLMRPLVGYRAGSAELDDQIMYPYYLRAVPGIAEEIKAIVLLLKEWGWMYVQVVNSNDYYSVNAEQVFREEAAKEGICIVAAHNIGKTDKDAQKVLIGLYAKRAVSTVVSLLDSGDNRRLLAVLANNTDIRRDLAIIATTRWGTSEMIVKDYEAVADGVISLSLRHSTLDSFRNYLSGLRVGTHKVNPWLNEWYMATHSCSMGVTVSGGAACDITQPITATNSKFKLMYEVESVINAVKAIARGLDATLKQYCGNSYTAVCNAFVNAEDKGEVFVDKIKEVVFTREDLLQPNLFRFRGKSAEVVFEVYNYKAGAYKKVRDVNPWTQNVDGSSTIQLFNGDSPDQVQAFWPTPSLECIYMFNYIKYWYIPGDVVIGSIFDIHYAGGGPLLCGDVRDSNGAMYTELFNFALDRINSGAAKVTLDNFKLGGLAADGCTNPNRASIIVNRLPTDMQVRSKKGDQFDPKTLVAWMTYDSQTTIKTADLLQGSKFPVVSPGATAIALNDKKKFNTFFRTIPSDSVIVKGMADFVNDMGWKYVIVLNSPDDANRESRDLFRKYLEGFGICILASFEFVTDGSNEVILRGIDEADSEVVAVFAEPDSHIEEFLMERENTVGLNSKLTFVANRRWGKYVDTYLKRATNNWMENSVFFELPNPTIGDFTTYLSKRNILNSDDNPWFSEVYESVMKCNLPGSFTQGRSSCDTSNPITNGQNWQQDIWTLSSINAIYTLANAINNVKISVCGAGVPLCPNFYSQGDLKEKIMAELDKEKVTNIANILFEYIDRDGNGLYNLLRYQANNIPRQEGSLDQIGSLTLNNVAALRDVYKDVVSSCPGECLICKDSSDFNPEITYISGDIYIVGLFDIHNPGFTPYSCKDINTKHGLPLQEAFNFAVEYVNHKKGIFSNKLNGVQLGAIGLDMCKQPTRAANLVANIHSGDIVLRKGTETISPRRIDAYVATMDTKSSIRVADILTQINIPQISYGATGNELLDRNKYSYFLRSVPADDKQARAVVSYLKKFNYNNIQVIYSFDEIGAPDFEEFEKVAFANRVCIKRKHLVGEQGLVTPADAAKLMRDVSRVVAPEDEVVVVWMKNPLPVLEAASADTSVASRFLFIVTDKMGADPSLLKMNSLKNLLQNKNLVTFDVETADIPAFDEYLENKTPDNYMSNPWFKEYFEKTQKCTWKANDASACDESLTLPRAEDYIQDPYVLYVINAVFSAAIGIDSALEDLCTIGGQPYYGVCDMYRLSGERRQKVMAGIVKSNFVDDTHQPFFYTPDGQSDRGFHIYNITSPQSNPNDFSYMNVGSYNDSNFLKLDITYDTTFKAQCDAEKIDGNTADDCVCPFLPPIPSRYMKKTPAQRGLTLVYVGDIHKPDPKNRFGCGPINVGADLQRLLAFFYAIDRVNANKDYDLLDSIKLDGLALDSCTNGLRLGQDIYNILSGNQLCDADGKGLVISPSTIIGFVVDKDKNAIPVSTMLSQQKIPVLSPTATSANLNDPYLHPYFLRTRNDDKQLARVIFRIAREAKWDYMSVIYTDNIQHRSAANYLMTESEQSNMCIAEAASLSEGATEQDVARTLMAVSQKVGSRAIVLFVEPAHLALLLKVMKSRGMSSMHTIVLPMDFAEPKQIPGLEQELDGAILLQTRTATLADFTRYVMSLTYTNRGGIPDDWFYDFYQTIHNCHLIDVEPAWKKDYPGICTKDEVITADMITQDPSVLHVIISVFSAVIGLNNIPECEGTSLDMAACLQVQEQISPRGRNELIFDGISDVDFQVLPALLGNKSFPFSYDDNGNGQVGYIIRNYRMVTESEKPSMGGADYGGFEIGQYSSIGDLTLDLSQYGRGRSLDSGKIEPSNCPVGECVCKLPGGREWLYRPERADALYYKMGDVCEDVDSGDEMIISNIPDSTDRFEKPWAIIMVAIAGLGALVSFCLFIYLLVMYPIRGGTSIVGFIISFGIILLYLMVLPFIAHANAEMCGLRRFGLGFVYSIVYSALLVKLIDSWRVRGKGGAYGVKYSKLGRPLGLFMVVVFLVLIQVMINTEWLILEEPDMERICYAGDAWPRCTPHDFYDESLVLSLAYVMVLIILCLFTALCSFTAATNHRESRWILGIIIVSIPCFVIWCAVATIGDYEVRDPAVAVGLLVNATVMLLLVPVRKLYLLHKYNVLIEEEEEDLQNQYAASQKSNDYNSVYGRQYSDTPRLHDDGSHLDSPKAY